MIPFTNEAGLRDFRCATPSADPLLRWLLVAVVLVILALSSCTHKLVVYVLPLPLMHDIGAWLDADQVCVPEPAEQAVYMARRCLSMAAIRSLILEARIADDEAPR